jgi:Tfp pilus assembly protein PilX
MFSVLKIFAGKSKREGGFVLVAALMAVMIIMALGFVALTTSSQDLRVSANLVAEGRALAAAEACSHEALRLHNPDATVTSTLPTGWMQIDPVVNLNTFCRVPPSFTYTSGTKVNPRTDDKNPEILVIGGEADKLARKSIIVITGRDGGYGSTASIQIGTLFKSPGGTDTRQGFN